MARVSGHHDQMEQPETNAASAYHTAVMADKPVAFWSLSHFDHETTPTKVRGEGEACGQPNGLLFGDPCDVDGELLGDTKPTVEHVGLKPIDASTEKGLKFTGAHNQAIKIPEHELINLKSDGYTERTVELWFKAEDPGATDRFIYAEGSEDFSGLSMYVNDNGGIKLNMFVWDHENDENEFGTPFIMSQPISCPIVYGVSYYVAMQFDSAAHTFSGHIGSPRDPASNSTSALTKCGAMEDMPSDVRLQHHGNSNGNAVIGGLYESARVNGGTLHEDDTYAGGTRTLQVGGGEENADTHNFKGSIGDVAIYNKALTMAELEAHFEAAQIA